MGAILDDSVKDKPADPDPTNSDLEQIGGKFEQTGVYSSKVGANPTRVNTLQHVLLVCSRFAPRPEGISSGMYANAECTLKMDPIVVIVHSFVFWNLRFQ